MVTPFACRMQQGCTNKLFQSAARFAFEVFRYVYVFIHVILFGGAKEIVMWSICQSDDGAVIGRSFTTKERNRRW